MSETIVPRAVLRDESFTADFPQDLAANRRTLYGDLNRRLKGQQGELVLVYYDVVYGTGRSLQHGARARQATHFACGYLSGEELLFHARKGRPTVCELPMRRHAREEAVSEGDEPNAWRRQFKLDNNPIVLDWVLEQRHPEFLVGDRLALAWLRRARDGTFVGAQSLQKFLAGLRLN